MVTVVVNNNQVDAAMRLMRKKLQREGIFRKMKEIRFYEKPSEKRARRAKQETRRRVKLEKKRKDEMA